MFALRSAVFDCVLPGFETADVPHGLLCSYELGSHVCDAAKLESNPGCLLELHDRFHFVQPLPRRPCAADLVQPLPRRP